jgi:hypothetical protein
VPAGHPDSAPTTPAEEWGERIDTGRKIACAGDDGCAVPGATGDEPADPRSGQADSRK